MSCIISSVIPGNLIHINVVSQYKYCDVGAIAFTKISLLKSTHANGKTWAIASYW
ncbi:hypothetical protein OGM63_03815 [Plectonema radiosum NIES-515]|uniref:Uncharacterized protein n=1 Tax=Plectonema radiosum NIES-515 TaxID=2986073 RepID=A0ABT3AUF1_9CYAN|nr:hypothetical protein [Plectonema radiosum]MCV3212665.1 hypothetical protein [Plectonema radiosum NIES-515]